MYCIFKGANTSSTYFYCDPTDMSCVSVGDKIVLTNFNFIPSDVGRDDWHQKVIGPVFHETRAEDSG